MVQNTQATIPNLLLIDDDRSFLEAMAQLLRSAGYCPQLAGSSEQGLAILGREAATIDLILLDVRMPGTDGLQTLEQIVRHYPAIPVIMVTGENAIDLVVRAMKTGATNYIYKGASGAELLEAIGAVMAHRRPDRQLANGHRPQGASFGIVGSSPALQQLLSDAARCAATMISVLITGETGVGKDMLARAIHLMSARSARPLITIDVPNIPATMFESELFGHTRGAFTGASDAKQGLLHAADGGTVFLDEIGEFPIELQSKFLHVLDTQSVRRLGSVTADQVDVRIVSATNRNLLESVRERKFREDLFYRLRGIELFVPPLRERREDIAPLAEHFLVEFVERSRMAPKRLSDSAIEVLERQRWPGNIRQLRRTVEAVSVMSEGELIEHTDVARILDRADSSHVADVSVVRDYNDVQNLARQTKKEELVRVLDRNDWNITRAAAELDIDRSTLSKQMKSLGINKPKLRL